MAWFLLSLLACRQTYDGPPPTGEGAAVYGRVVGLLGSGLGSVEVCAVGLDVGCTTSEGDGDFLLEGFPSDADVLVSMQRDGHLPTVFHHHTTVDEEWRKVLMSDAIVNLMMNRADTEPELGRGHAMFILWSGPDYDDFERVEGVRFDVLDTDEGERFYQADGGFPDLDLTETSRSGSGGVFNLEPGEYALVFESSDVVCEPWFSYDFEPGDPVPVTVLPDQASYIDLVCR